MVRLRRALRVAVRSNQRGVDPRSYTFLYKRLSCVFGRLWVRHGEYLNMACEHIEDVMEKDGISKRCASTPAIMLNKDTEFSDEQIIIEQNRDPVEEGLDETDANIFVYIDPAVVTIKDPLLKIEGIIS